MHLSTWASALLVLVVLLHVDVVGSRGGRGGGGRGGGGGGRSSGGRGTSAGRTSSNRGSSGSYSGGTSYSGNRGTSGGGISTFSKGTGMGSMMRGSTFKAAIAGAAAGYLTYKAGRAVIGMAGGSMMWGNRPYYWGSNYYQHRSGYEMCAMPLESDKTFSDVYFEDGSRPKQIVWSCRSYAEYCCGYECCPSRAGYGGGGFFGGGLFIFFIILLLLVCCGGVVLYKFFRKSLDCILGSNDKSGAAGNAESSVPFNPPVPPPYAQPNYPQAYPSQPFAGQAYPLQPQYPQQQPPPPYGFKPY